jgi:hypothetical protein
MAAGPGRTWLPIRPGLIDGYDRQACTLCEFGLRQADEGSSGSRQSGYNYARSMPQDDASAGLTGSNLPNRRQQLRAVPSGGSPRKGHTEGLTAHES